MNLMSVTSFVVHKEEGLKVHKGLNLLNICCTVMFCCSKKQSMFCGVVQRYKTSF